MYIICISLGILAWGLLPFPLGNPVGTPASQGGRSLGTNRPEKLSGGWLYIHIYIYVCILVRGPFVTCMSFVRSFCFNLAGSKTLIQSKVLVCHLLVQRSQTLLRSYLLIFYPVFLVTFFRFLTGAKGMLSAFRTLNVTLSRVSVILGQDRVRSFRAS